MLRGIDISVWQRGIDLFAIDCDFVIVKATEGTRYVNDDFKRQADQVLETGKLLGIYHYAYGKHSPGSAKEEARRFLDYFVPYVGKAIPMLDWEAEAQSLPVSWAKEWLDTIKRETGVTPWFYGYASYLNSRDHSEIAHYPLWMASYLSRYEHHGWIDDPVNIWNTGSWDSMIAYQYSSTGHISGWNGDLDLNVFYGTRDDWVRMEGGNVGSLKKFCDAMRWAADSDRVGYSQSDRESLQEWKFFTDEDTNTDCSKLTIEALQYAGFDTGKATYTGNMSQELCTRGWERLPVGTPLQAGDILLNDVNHVAVWLGDCLAQASIGEGGLVSGGAPGDQTGWEVNTRDYYDYPWNCILRYMGGEDDVTMSALDELYESPTGDGTVGSVKDRLAYVDMRVREMHAQIAALTEAMKVLAESKGVDPEKIAKSVDKAVKDRLEKITLNVKAS